MAAKRKRKPTVNQQIAANERKRIRNAMRRLERRGYIFNQEVIPDQPKRVTQKYLQKLKAINTNTLYGLSEYVDTSTGESISGEERRTQERKERSKKAADTRRRRKKAKQRSEAVQKENLDDIWLDNIAKGSEAYADKIIKTYRDMYNYFSPKVVALLDRFMDKLLADHEKQDVAVMLETAMESGHLLTYKEAYDAAKMAVYLEKMVNFFPEMGSLYKEELVDLFYYEEDWRL